MKPSPDRAYFRFQGELNDHLTPAQQQQAIKKSFYVPGTVMDSIESLGVPHTEVGRIDVNGQPASPSYVLQSDDQVVVYPSERRDQSLSDPELVLDAHLGKLAAYLRMLGFDTLYRSCFTDPELVRVAAEQRRILLTRDRALLKHRAVQEGYWVRHTDSRLQTAEVVDRFSLAQAIRPFIRCMACNGTLHAVDKEQVRPVLPARTAELHDEFWQCPRCGRVYWKGSHYDRMQRWIQELTANSALQRNCE